MTTTAPRERLPDRRPNQTRVIRWAGSDDQPTEFSVTVGYFLDGRPGEVFANGPKVGSAMQALLEDSCVAVSIALQHGVTPEALAHSMGRTPISKTEIYRDRRMFRSLTKAFEHIGVAVIEPRVEPEAAAASAV